MGKIIIQEYTTKKPITMIGAEAGVCYGSDIIDNEKNYKRGINCLKTNHGRTWEFPDVYMILDGYSARVAREFYTHIAGAPTRLQASTRYINYAKGFDYVTPGTIKKDPERLRIFDEAMKNISEAAEKLDEVGVPREDIAMLLPLGMETRIVCKHNFRNLVSMSQQRMCTRAYWEYRQVFSDLSKALSEYSDEWKYLVDNYFMPKCEFFGFCTEVKSCGKKPKKENKVVG